MPSAAVRTADAAAREEIRQAQETIPQRMNAALAKIDNARDQALKRAKSRARELKANAEEEAQRARWEAATVFEAARSGAETDLERTSKRIGDAEASLVELHDATDAFRKQCRMTRVTEASEPSDERIVPPEDPLSALEATNADADQRLTALERMFLPKLYRDANFLTLYIVIGLAVVVPAALATDPLTGLLIGIVAALLAGTLLTVGLYRLAQRQVAARYPSLGAALARGDLLVQESRDWSSRLHEQRLATMQQTHTAEVRQGERRLAGKRAQIEEELERESTTVETDARTASDRVRQEHQDELAGVVQVTTGKLQDLQTWYETALREQEDSDRSRREAFQTSYNQLWADLRASWGHAMEGWSTEVESINALCDRSFHDWSAPDADQGPWSPPASGADAMRFGRVTVDLAAIPRGMPRDERLRAIAGPSGSTCRRSRRSPKAMDLFWSATYGDGREPAARPAPGADAPDADLGPTGQGPVHHRRPGRPGSELRRVHAPGRLRRGARRQPDLDRGAPHRVEAGRPDRAHGEGDPEVPPQRVRDDPGVQRPRRRGGRAVPRRWSIANFPANFNEGAARRLLSICQSGPRCGVYPLIMVDERETMPPGITLADLERGRDGSGLARRAARLEGCRFRRLSRWSWTPRPAEADADPVAPHRRRAGAGGLAGRGAVRDHRAEPGASTGRATAARGSRSRWGGSGRTSSSTSGSAREPRSTS